MQLLVHKNRWYHHLISCFFIIVFPFLLGLIIYLVIQSCRDYEFAVDMHYSVAFGGLFGFLFHILCIIFGLIKNEINVVRERWSEFYDNLIVGFGFSVKQLFYDIKSNGLYLWLYLSIMLCNALFSVNSFLFLLTYYSMI